MFACVADIGWITGHSYVVYGPLCNGGTSVLFESHPAYPDPGKVEPLYSRHLGASCSVLIRGSFQGVRIGVPLYTEVSLFQVVGIGAPL